MKRWKGLLLSAIIFAGASFMFGFFVKYHLPKLKTWVLIEIERQSDLKTPFRVWAESVEISLLPLGVVFSEIQVLPKEELKQKIAPLKIQSLSLGINWLALFRGEVRVSSLRVSQPEIILILKDNPFAPSEGTDKKPDINIDWKTVFDIPIDKIVIDDLKLLARLQEPKIAVQLEEFNFSVENRFDSLLVALDAPHISVKQSGDNPIMQLAVETRFLMDPSEIQLAALKISREQSYLVASGRLNGDFGRMNLAGGALDVRGSLQISESEDWVHALLDPSKRLPYLAGVVDLDARVAMDPKSTLPKLELSLETRDLKIDQFEIDQFAANAHLNNQQLSFRDFRVQNSSGQAQIKDLQIDLSDKKTLKGVIESPHLEVGRMLKTLGVGDVPVSMTASGSLPCSGELYPQLNIQCSGDIHGKDLHVFPGGAARTLVKVPELHAKGDVRVDNKGVFYKAQLGLGEKSKGSSDGQILYETGFKINYSAENAEFSEVSDLLGLGFEGRAQLNGSTEGDSKTATMKMDISTKDLWVKGYLLGQAQTEVRYSSGVVSLRKINGVVGTSRYEGHLNVNVLNETMQVDVKVPFADLDDVKNVISRHLPIPFAVSGTGSGEFRGTGGLDIDELDYTLTSSFFRGTVESESYDELIFNLKGSQGTAQAQKVQMSKSSSLVQLQGSLSHAGATDVNVTGKDLRLEQSETLGKLGLDLTGRFDFKTSIKGQLPEPRIETNGHLSKLVIGDRPSDDSNFNLVLDADGFSGKGEFLGDKVKTSFLWPLKTGTPFEFNFSSLDWDFTQLFQILSQSARQKDFETRLTSNINLRAENGRVWASNGQVQIDQFFIKRGELGLSSSKPMQLIFDKGKISSQNFLLEGQNSFLKLESMESTEDRLNASINAKLDMSLLSLMTPFLEDLRGPLSLSMSLQGPVLEPQIVGSAYIENGSVKLKEFPHPLSRIRADLLFNQKNILINALTAELGGGQLSGDGRIVLKNINNIPVNIQSHFRDVNINFPEGMKSKGSGQLSITGDYFPYVLGLKYDVAQADVTMEFTGASESDTLIKPSSFLPKFLAEERFQAVRLDLDINLLKPASVKNSMADMLIRGALEVKGTPESPLLKGTLTPLQGGKLKFRENIFEIDTGYIEYNFDPPNNPTLLITSQARVTEVIPTEDRSIRNDYDVRLLAQGKAKNPKITLESQPPLSEREIVSLLALGMTTSTIDQGSTRGDQQSAAAPGVIGTQIGAQLFESQIGRQFKDRLGVDFKIGTQFNTDENASFPKVTFSKQWTPKFEGSASRTIEPNPTSDVKLEYKFNKNTSVIGFWEGKQENASQNNVKRAEDESKIGLDLEYKFEFR